MFSARLSEQVKGLNALNCQQVNGVEAALEFLESDNPEILLLQASQQSNWEICRSIKQHRRFLWCYCILLDERDCPQTHTNEAILLRQAGVSTTALEIGADAYLWFPNFSKSKNEDAHDHLDRLVQAHIRTAIRRIQAHNELLQTNDLLSSIALVDPLTQLGNRRAFDWELPRQLQVSRDQEQSLSLLILDIDFFKKVNDEYGHLVGDQVLRMFASRLRHNMRFYETPFRYGGEEFIVILQNTSLQEAQKVAERLRRLINDAPFVINRHLDLPLTVSIGVATVAAGDNEPAEQLLGRADQNLLRAKSTGRNRVITN
ncbi:GGDEF domain-containing protein [Oscillatoria sp. CS-180]|uniref:GGDEF domain-containing protein n=1 Tax=Oscillatoria sp. CS-180 TaxID=3021720 RepID=UPI00232ABB4F|nr:GGDEF domain-containing protein [Oscillatoria sp. CS-180]MDB9529812.1 GGDEF domain-containing protein [Oscillatoria sp. CS-180]